MPKFPKITCFVNVCFVLSLATFVSQRAESVQIRVYKPTRSVFTQAGIDTTINRGPHHVFQGMYSETYDGYWGATSTANVPGFFNYAHVTAEQGGYISPLLSFRGTISGRVYGSASTLKQLVASTRCEVIFEVIGADEEPFELPINMAQSVSSPGGWLGLLAPESTFSLNDWTRTRVTIGEDGAFGYSIMCLMWSGLYRLRAESILTYPLSTVVANDDAEVRTLFYTGLSNCEFIDEDPPEITPENMGYMEVIQPEP